MAIEDWRVNRPLPEQLETQYQQRFGNEAAYRNQVWKILCSDFFPRYIPREGKILELGAGWGEFINNIDAADRYAMDLNPATAGMLSPEVTGVWQDCSQPWNFADSSFDVIFTSNFLEHLPDRISIERTIKEAYRCLKTGGCLICLGPNIKYVPGAYWDFWDHVVPLTDLSCEELLRLCNFTVEERIPRFLPYSMSQGKKPNLLLVRLYLHLPLCWPLFGKQFLVIGRKLEYLSKGKV